MASFFSKVLGRPGQEAAENSSTTMSIKNTEASFKKLVLDALKCPVCYEIKSGRIYQCLNGHNVCSDCRPLINGDKCCLCEVQLTSNRNRLAEHLAANIVGVPCRNVLEGCKLILLENKMAAHLPVCTFSYSCFVTKILPSAEPYIDGDCVECKWRGSRIGLLEHVTAVHPGHAFNNVVTMSITGVNFNSPRRICNKICLLAYRGHLFWVRLGIYRSNRVFQFGNKLTMYAYVQHVLIPPGNEGRFSCEFRFPSLSRKALTMSFVADARPLGDDDDEGMQICECLVESLVTADKRLKCNVRVVDLKKAPAIMPSEESEEFEIVELEP